MALVFQVSFSGIIQRNFSYHDRGEGGTLYSTNPSSSIVNDFIPYHALMSGKLLNADNTKALLYSLDTNVNPANVRKNYEEFFKALVGSYLWIKLDKKNTVLDYRCRAGQLVEISKDNIVTPLMTLVVNKEHLFSINKENPDLSKFFIVINKEFSGLEKHSNLYKNFCKYYLDIAINHVNVIYTKNIIDLCYRQVPIVPIRPKTIAESRMLYKELTINVLKAISYNEYT